MGGATGNIGRRHAKRIKDRLAHPLRNADASRGLNHLAEDVEALVRVDPALLGSSDGAAPLERQARGVGEQVTDRRPLGTRGIIEGNQASFDSNQHRPGDDRLGYRREREDAIDISVRKDDVALDTKDEGDIERRQRADHAVASGAAPTSAAAVVFSLILRSVRA